MKPAPLALIVIFAAGIGAGIFMSNRRDENAATTPAPAAVATNTPTNAKADEDRVAAAVAAANAPGIDMTGGFIEEGDYQLVRAQCTVCHSSKLVLQNRATREGWEKMIRWMQASQRLWDLGENEPKILDYLAKYYGPVDQGRRAPLKVDGWYEVE